MRAILSPVFYSPATMLMCCLLLSGCRKTPAAQADLKTVSTVATNAGSVSNFTGGPRGICVDEQGNIFFSTDEHSILQINAIGSISLLAGGNDGCMLGSGAAATFTHPVDISLDLQHHLFVTDRNCPGLRTLTTDGSVTLFCASDTSAGINLETPAAVGTAQDGTIYVGSYKGSDGITTVDRAGNGSHFAGNGITGIKDGPLANAGFSAISGICLNKAGDLFVADENCIRVISNGTVTTLAGSNAKGYSDGIGGSALFGGSMGICLDVNGNLFVADPANAVIRMVTPEGVVTTIAGTPGLPGYEDGPAGQAKFFAPQHLCFDTGGNLYISDLGTDVNPDLTGHIRKISF